TTEVLSNWCQTCRIRCPASCTLGTSAPCMRRDPPMGSSVPWAWWMTAALSSLMPETSTIPQRSSE
ncbi:hypothetical protein ILYODFUR_023076, partial [Ilyodon furcidens]